MDGVQTLFRSVGSTLYQDVIHGLREIGFLLSDERNGAIETMFTSFQNPFVHLHTQYHQNKYIKDHLNYLVIQITIK